MLETLNKKFISYQEQNNVLRTKLDMKNFENSEDNTCSICCDDMNGCVILKCGHTMCPECFANHSRVNNNCPFCRMSFAKKIETRENIPNEVVNSIIESLFDPETTATPDNYFEQLSIIIRNHDTVTQTSAFLEYIVKQNSRIIASMVARWYDA